MTNRMPPNGCAHVVDLTSRFMAVADAARPTPSEATLVRTACAEAHRCYVANAGAPNALTLSLEEARSIVSRPSCPSGRGHSTSFFLAELGYDRVRVAWTGGIVCYRLRRGRLVLQTAPLQLGGRTFGNTPGGDMFGHQLTRFDIRLQDRLIVCTDWVWRSLSDAGIADLLSDGDDPNRIAEAIIHEATVPTANTAACIVALMGEGWKRPPIAGGMT